jgi:hypothetical protein
MPREPALLGHRSVSADWSSQAGCRSAVSIERAKGRMPVANVRRWGMGNPGGHKAECSRLFDCASGERGADWGVLPVWLYAAICQNPPSVVGERQLSGGEIADRSLVLGLRNHDG